jgi:uncharacterized protein (TIGR02646 family)
MIKIDRGRVGCPAYIDGPGSAGHQEMLDNDAEHLAGTNEFTFEAYKHQTVKDALEDLFGRKCAYCESDIKAVHPSEIEHYRPKGRIVEWNPVTKKLDRQTGYYWLAARWSNLLVSCIDCNRRRKHKDANGKLMKSGKADYFPLATGSARASNDAALVGEVPMLLNPCEDDPRKHLEFTDAGGIKPRQTNGFADARGAETIKLLGLARGGLIESRADHALSVNYCLLNIREALVFGGNVNRHLTELLRLLDPKKQHTALTRHLAATELPAMFNGVVLPPALDAALKKVVAALNGA